MLLRHSHASARVVMSYLMDIKNHICLVAMVQTYNTKERGYMLSDIRKATGDIWLPRHMYIDEGAGFLNHVKRGILLSGPQ